MQQELFANNPELWKAMYGQREGEVIVEPTTDEEFDLMLEQWEGRGDWSGFEARPPQAGPLGDGPLMLPQ